MPKLRCLWEILPSVTTLKSSNVFSSNMVCWKRIAPGLMTVMPDALGFHILWMIAMWQVWINGCENDGRQDFLVNKWLKFQSVPHTQLSYDYHIIRLVHKSIQWYFVCSFFGDWQHIHTHLLLLNGNIQPFCQTSTFVLRKRKKVNRFGATCE